MNIKLIHNKIIMIEYTFTFKIYSLQMKIDIAFPSNISIKEFVNIAKKEISQRFNMYILSYNMLEIIEAGQYNNRNGFAPELADKIELCYDENSTLEEIFGITWKNVSFYVRIL
jgi:hypothetical protein